ncbi:MAG: RsmE family RNA methyltransferase [Spirochaetota bacterium]
MPQFFIKSSNLIENKCLIEGEDFRHLRKVRRVKPGDLIDLRIDNGLICKGKICTVNADSLTVEILETKEGNSAGPDLNLILYASILKGKAFDFALQKAVETGVSKIIPVVTERTIPVIERNSSRKARWEKIASAAAKQCMRKDIPVVADVITFSEAVSKDRSGTKIIAHPEQRSIDIKQYFTQKEKTKDVSLLIGPEGGFTDKEVDLAEENGWNSVIFGFTSLRAETASIVFPAIVIYEWSSAGGH